MTKNNTYSNTALICLRAILIGAFSTVLLSLAFALIMGKLNRYEVLYPWIAILLQCLFFFISARLVITKKSNRLLLFMLLQFFLCALILFVVSSLVNGRMVNLSSFLYSLIYQFFSSFLALFIPQKKKRKK